MEKMIKNFNLYKHPKLGIRSVKIGFCWPAFFFTYIMGFVFLAFAVCCSFFIFCSTYFMDFGRYFFPANVFVAICWILIAIAINFLLGYKGNSWREKDIIRQGLIS